MPRDRRGVKGKGSPKALPSPSFRRWIFLLPILVAVVLNLPSLGLGYFWDDFYFLSTAGAPHLLPSAHATFYRPIPLGIYFKVLALLDPRNGILGHLLNLAALAGVIVLLVMLVKRLCGSRAGIFSGILLASYGCIPALVAWVSGSQDLLAMLFVAAAFLLRDRGKNLAALACATAGVLCKEPAIAAFPALLLWDRILGREPRREMLQLLGYGLVALAWAAVHPGIHLLAGRGFKSGATTYVGLEHSERWGLYVARYVMTALNLPAAGMSAPWWEDRVLYGFAALAVLIFGLIALSRRHALEGSVSCRPSRIAVLAALFVIPGLLMPALLVRHWAPYFACLPALGVALFLGPVLARRSTLTATLALSVFLLLGIWTRGERSEEESVLSEPAMVESSSAVKTVRSNFRRLFPTLPKGSEVLLSFGTSGIRGIQSALIDGQALGLWYRDPTLRAVHLWERLPGAPREYLVRVTDDLDLILFDPQIGNIRSAREAAPNPGAIHRPTIDYARAVAAGGDTDRAIRILEGLTSIEPAELGSYNRRVIASILLAAGRKAEADSVLKGIPPFPRDVALTLVFGLLSDAGPSERLDMAAFEAFGLSASDPDAIRSVMVGFERKGSLAQSAWYALKLKQLAPGDSTAAEILTRAAREGITPRREP